MKKRNGTLEKLNKIPQIVEDYKNLLFKMIDYYEIYDIECNGNKRKIFIDLYIHNYSNIKVALNNNISLPTLSRYIRKFDYLAKKIISHCSGFERLKEFIS